MKVTLALGANIGNPGGQLREAVDRIGALMTVNRVSSIYLTEPVGAIAQPDYFNIVLIGDTELPVYAVQAGMHRLETEMGRERRERDEPRPIDVDLIAYGPLVLTSRDLTVPHPRFAARTFVLVPIVEIDPVWRDPVTGATASDLLAAIEVPTQVRKLGPL